MRRLLKVLLSNIEKMEKGDYFVLAKIAGLSFLLWMLVFWTAGISFALCSSIEGVFYLAFTYFCCKKFATGRISCAKIVLAIIVGRFVVELPVRVASFSATLVSLLVSIMSLAGILLGWLCAKKNKAYVWLLSVLIILIVSIFYRPLWFDYFYK